MQKFITIFVTTTIVKINRNNLNSISNSISLFQNQNQNDNRWNIVEIDFFNSHYNDKIIVTTFVIEHVKKNFYYRDIHVFLNKVQNISIIKKSKLIRNNFYNCFRDQILKWYTFILFKKMKFYDKHEKTTTLIWNITKTMTKVFFFRFNHDYSREIHHEECSSTLKTYWICSNFNQSN